MTTDVEIITYSLRGQDGTSDTFYRELAGFADEVLAEAAARMPGTAKDVLDWVKREGHEQPRAELEYLYDLLSLGVLWTVHAGRTEALPPAPRAALGALSRLRRRGPIAEKVADVFRGLLSGMWLAHARQPAVRFPLRVTSLTSLQNWLEATGSFEDEAEQVRGLADYFGHFRAEEANAALAEIVDFAAWFERRSLTALGGYTPNVEDFLTRIHPNHRWKADYLFAGRTRVEYHLNMVGHELLNRAQRREFLATRQRMLLVPPCMRAQREEDCRAKATPLGSRCAGCTPTCRVYELTRLGREHGIEVRIIPDELRVFAPASPGKTMGVTGVSCALTNAPGGLETRRLGIPAQGVLLDYCGCRYHWHAQGIPTDLNVAQLKRVLGIGQDEGSAAPMGG